MLIALVATELRGFLIAGPVLYMIAIEGGPLVAAWVVFCVVAGVCASIAAARWVHRVTG